jgi:hypothetical protein
MQSQEMSTDKLTDLMCKRARPSILGPDNKAPGAPTHSRLYDGGGGFYLNCAPNGQRRFRQQYRTNGKKCVIVHGVYGAPH